MIIDADGLFNGGRWRKCSNAARLHAPYLLLASNGYGRLELDPARIVGRAFLTFSPRPSEDVILGFVREYVGAHLMFLYERDGQVWGQWDTPDRLLAKYLTTADKRSPTPPKEQFDKWRSDYRNRREPATDQAVTGDSEKVLEVFKDLPSGEGVGVGVGEGKNTCSSPNGNERVGLLFPTPQRGKRSAGSEWFDQFWRAYWRRVSRKAAYAAFVKCVTSQARFDEVMVAVQAQSAEMMARSPDKRPHASTWLNQERWNDEPIETARPKRSDALTALYAELEQKQQETNVITEGS
jgi:hypothetical protein